VLAKKALAIREKLLDPEHPDVAESLNRLGVIYSGQGRYIEAERLYKRALAILEKALGSENKSVGIAIDNLAMLYRFQARCARVDGQQLKAEQLCNNAEVLYKRAQGIFDNVLSPHDRDRATYLNSLAGFYRELGRHEAEKLYKNSLDILEKVLPPNHPDLASSVKLSRLSAVSRCCIPKSLDRILMTRRISGSASEKRPWLRYRLTKPVIIR